MKKKSGQMELSFGMIFSIILIIVFIMFAFYVIKILLQNQSRSEVLMFKEDLQNDVDKVWKGSGSISNPNGYNLPKKIELICFADFSSPAEGNNQELYKDLKKTYNEFENLVFYPVGSAQGLDSTEIKHIDIDKITSLGNPFCVENSDGKIKLTIKRDYGEELVFIEKQN